MPIVIPRNNVGRRTLFPTDCATVAGPAHADDHCRFRPEHVAHCRCFQKQQTSHELFAKPGPEDGACPKFSCLTGRNSSAPPYLSGRSKTDQNTIYFDATSRHSMPSPRISTTSSEIFVCSDTGFTFRWKTHKRRTRTTPFTGSAPTTGCREADMMIWKPDVARE